MTATVDQREGSGRPEELSGAGLPLRHAPLFGRESLLGELRAALTRPEVHLLTLTGAGGVGKTRLALQAASDLRQDFDDGVCVIDLAPIGDPGLVAGAVARALGLPEVGESRLLERLRSFLSARRALLVLDNVEHVRAAAPLLVELIAASRSLKLLVTSRTALRVSGEWAFPVPPLDVPAPAEHRDPRALARSPSVRLFVDAAAHVQPGFDLSEANAPAVAEVCVRLGGLPLAIELAAARARLFSPEEILARLADPLELLTGGPRDAPPRLQTLRATLEWSYGLLDPDERRLFRRLAAFTGDFTVAGAEEVLGADGAADRLTALLDIGLLARSRRAGPGSRLQMLETIRAFALEELSASGEEAAARDAHASFYRDLAETGSPKLASAEQAHWLERLDAEHDNLRGALRRLLDEGDGTGAARLAIALCPFWLASGRVTEGRRWLAEAIAKEPEPEPRARALAGAAVLAVYQADYRPAEALAAEALELGRELGDGPATAQALEGLALVAQRTGDPAEALALYDQALAVFRAIGDRHGTARALEGLGLSGWFGDDVEAARRALAEAIEISGRLGDARGAACPRIHLAWLDIRDGDLASARATLADVLPVLRSLGDRWHAALALQADGWAAAYQSSPREARSRFEESLALFAELGDTLPGSGCAIGLARLAADDGRPDDAVRLLAAAEGVRERAGIGWPPGMRRKYEETLAGARSALDEKAFARAWSKGAGLTLDGVLAAERSPRFPAGLTEREVDVLRLVALGLRDAQIAEELVVSVRTVQSRLRSIYGKLNVGSRTAAARYAAEHDLL